MAAIRLTDHPVHLGLGATAEMEPVFASSAAWYAAYSQRHSDDGAEGRLVSMHTFNESWDVWEKHPTGAEVVVCVAGSMTLF